MYASFIKMLIYISRFDCEVEQIASNKANIKGLGNAVEPEVRQAMKNQPSHSQ